MAVEVACLWVAALAIGSGGWRHTEWEHGVSGSVIWALEMGWVSEDAGGAGVVRSLVMGGVEGVRHVV